MSAPRLLVRATRASKLNLHKFTSIARPAFYTSHQIKSTRLFSTTRIAKMPESTAGLTPDTDPSVQKQYDNETPKDQQMKEFLAMADEKKIGILSTYRKGVGPVGRSMAVAKRNGPDFLFIANKNSRKFEDLKENKEVQITFQDSKNQDWISISGTATTTSNSDPRINDAWSQGTRAWFGDLGDGKHTGGPEDPRVTLIEVKSKFIVYWKTEVGTLGFVKEVVGAAVGGGVANTGKLRELSEQDIEKARSMQ